MYLYKPDVIILWYQKFETINCQKKYRYMYLYQVSYLYLIVLKQDIFNAVLKEHPYFVYHLPCQWNVQLSDNSKSDKCYNQLEEPKVNN